MDLQIIYTLIAGLLLLVSCLGTIFPVLPGSLLTIATLLVWAWLIGSPAAWVAAGIGAFFALIGWSASAILTGRKMKEQRIPHGSILVALVATVIGAFVIPVAGLFIGFAVGLFAAEAYRHREFGGALRSSVEALKAMGIGIIIEFGCASLAASIWMIGVITHFVIR